jgi:hypothetical protein
MFPNNLQSTLKLSCSEWLLRMSWFCLLELCMIHGYLKIFVMFMWSTVVNR